MPAQQLRLKQAERLWLLTGEIDVAGHYDIWWPVDNPEWKLYEAGTVFDATWASIVDGMVLVVELRDQDGRLVGWDVDECAKNHPGFQDLFEVVACPV